MSNFSASDDASLWDSDSTSHTFGQNAESEASGLLSFALGFADRGWSVFPLHTPDIDGRCSCRRDCGRDNGKHPRTRHGLKDATTDGDLIQRWWTTWPLANIGIATGLISGIFVLDVDADRGWDSLHALQERYGALPDTPGVITGSDGGHLYFQHPGERVLTTAGKLGPGLDVRGDGGYVVAPPSLHRSGRRYHWDSAWHPNRLALAGAPPWLLALVTVRSPSSGPGTPHRCDAAESFVQGGRNTALTSLAGTMRRRGFSEEAILAALLVENESRCQPPLETDEVAKIARSVARYASVAPPVTSWRGVRIREVHRAGT